MIYSLIGEFLMLATALFAYSGDWTMWRHDGLLTGYQPLNGNIKTPPKIIASHFLGSGTGAIIPADLSGNGIKQEYLVVARSRIFAYDSGGKQIWESNPPGYWLQQIVYVDDLDADGKSEIVALAGDLGGTRWAFLILDSKTGNLLASYHFNQGQFGYSHFCGAYVSGIQKKQILLVTSGKQSPNGGWETHGRIMLLQYGDKQILPLWNFEPNEYAIEYPATLIGDLTGQGRSQVVVDSWCHVWNVDLNTGELLSHTTWDPEGANQRHYGWNQLVDVSGDGRLDFVNVSLTKHVDVLRCDEDGKLSLSWTHAWPDPVTTESRSIVCPADPIADIDGDGAKEIVTGLFDGLTDNRWHLFAFDAITGKLKAEIPDLVPIACAPLFGSSSAVFCNCSSTNARETGKGYEIWYVHDGKWEKLWASLNDKFVLEPVSSNEHVSANANALNARRAVIADVDGDGRMEFFTRSQGKIQAWGIDDGHKIVKEQGEIPVPTQPPIPPLPALQGRTVPYILAGDTQGKGRNNLLLYDGSAITELILEGDQLREGFSINSTEIPIICKLLGDETSFILISGRQKDQNLFIEAIKLPIKSSDDKPFWHFTFENSQGCGQYMQAIFFTVGHFTGRKHFDLFTYSTKPGARSYVLDGRTGQPIWEKREIPEIERHFQAFGGRASVWDYDNDGEDDILFCCPDYYCVADGRTGDLHVGPVFLPTITKRWAAYSSPAVLAQEGKSPIIYLGGAYESRLSIQLDAKSGLWSEFLSTDQWQLAAGFPDRFSEGLLPSVKDGRNWRIVQAQVDGKFVCFDAMTGQHAWDIQLETAPSAIISGDVDGDGMVEFLFGGQNGKLYVYRDAGDHPDGVWQKQFDGPVGTPLLADLDGDGKSEIILSIGDGNIVVLK